jgi:hypothetical protein
MIMDNTATSLPVKDVSWPHIYPNPVSNQPAIVVLPENEANQPVTVDILTIEGKLLSRQENVMAKNIVIDNKQLPPGHYIYHISCKNGSVYKGKFEVE